MGRSIQDFSSTSAKVQRSQRHEVNHHIPRCLETRTGTARCASRGFSQLTMLTFEKFIHSDGMGYLGIGWGCKLLTSHPCSPGSPPPILPSTSLGFPKRTDSAFPPASSTHAWALLCSWGRRMKFKSFTYPKKIGAVGFLKSIERTL